GVCGVADEDRKMLVFLAFSAIGENNDSDIDVEDTLDISSSSSSSEDELVNIILVLNKKRGKLEVRPRIQHYVEETIPRFSDHEFKSHFSVLAGYAGCVHDARVFRLSLVQEYINNPAVYFPNDSHIIGDAAYGIHSNQECRLSELLGYGKAVGVGYLTAYP
ncbi:hypothetical protein PV325_012062, partial [Microctonus aethiopoides]